LAANGIGFTARSGRFGTPRNHPAAGSAGSACPQQFPTNPVETKETRRSRRRVGGPAVAMAHPRARRSSSRAVRGCQSRCQSTSQHRTGLWRSGWICHPDVSCTDSTQGYCVDADHQPTDLAVGGANPLASHPPPERLTGSFQNCMQVRPAAESRSPACAKTYYVEAAAREIEPWQTSASVAWRPGSSGSRCAKVRVRRPTG
jgi:hypothetical protein